MSARSRVWCGVLLVLSSLPTGSVQYLVLETPIAVKKINESHLYSSEGFFSSIITFVRIFFKNLLISSQHEERERAKKAETDTQIDRKTDDKKKLRETERK